MAEINFLTPLHTRTKRNYVQRVVAHDKAECADVARQWGYDYWDGDRKYGYGGYTYDGRWRPVAEKMIEHYGLKAGQKVLDVGCGKAFLLYEMTQALPGLVISGIDISQYGIENAKDEVRQDLTIGTATELPWPDDTFDLVYSINTLHNLKNFELASAFKEIQRVGKKHKYICVESYRTEQEKANLLYWQLTCETFFQPDEWRWFGELHGYEGNFEFIFFE